MAIAQLRQQKKITQKRLADQVGVTQSYICALEKKRKANPSYSLLQKIAKALDVDIGILLKELDIAG